jgi:V8-like Glu-specific endopeptidase
MMRLFACLALFLAIFQPAAEAVINHPATLTAAAARRYPYNFVGQLYFTSGAVDYIGSGTVVRPRSVLTAGHNVYDPQGGWSTDVEFRRSAYGATAMSDVFAMRVLALAGYQARVIKYGPDSLASFAFDTGGLVFAKPLAGGAYIAISATPALMSSSFLRVGVGYGAEIHSGDYPLYVVPTTGFVPIVGSYWETSSMTVEGGMSGGPLFARLNPSLFVVAAVIVASSGPPAASGVRRVDASVVSFVSSYLP